MASGESSGEPSVAEAEEDGVEAALALIFFAEPSSPSFASSSADLRFFFFSEMVVSSILLSSLLSSMLSSFAFFLSLFSFLGGS